MNKNFTSAFRACHDNLFTISFTNKRVDRLPLELVRITFNNFLTLFRGRRIYAFDLGSRIDPLLNLLKKFIVRTDGKLVVVVADGLECFFSNVFCRR